MADDFDFACPRSVEFAEAYALPGAEVKIAIFNGNAKRRADEHGFDVGGAVAAVVEVVGLPVGDQLVKLGQDVVFDIGVHCFGDGDGSGGVGAEEVADAIAEGRRNGGVDLLADVNDFRCFAGFDFKFRHGATPFICR